MALPGGGGVGPRSEVTWPLELVQGPWCSLEAREVSKVMAPFAAAWGTSYTGASKQFIPRSLSSLQCPSPTPRL